MEVSAGDVARRKKLDSQDIRHVGDEFTWMIPFDTLNVTWSKTPHFVLEHANVQISPDTDDRTVDAPYSTITVRIFVSEVLRYPYLYGVSSWMKFLGKRVDSLTRLELHKIPPDERSDRAQRAIDDYQYLYDSMEGSRKPDGWTYWDDQVPVWYQAWRQSEQQSKKG